MRTTIIAFFIVLLGGIQPSMADVIVELPKDFRVMAVNGKDTKVRKSVHLPNGTNQMALRVVKEVGKKFDSDVAYSDVIVMKFTASNAKLHIRIPKIRNGRDMKRFNKNLSIELLNAQDKKIPLITDRLLYEGFQLMRDYERELAVYNNTNAPAAIPALTAVYAEAVTPSVQPTVPVKTSSQTQTVQPVQPKKPRANKVGSGVQADEMLDYWYQQADEETRREFLKKIGH